MNWKWIILLLVTLEHAYRLFLNVVEHRSAGNPTPANVADVYDAETYQRWKSYQAEKSRLSIVSTAVSFVALAALLLTDAYAAFAALLPQGTFWQLLWVLLLVVLLVCLSARRWISKLRNWLKSMAHRLTLTPTKTI